MQIVAERTPGGQSAVDDRRLHERLDANCPVVVELYFANQANYISTTGRLINISLKGCLVASEYLPWKNADPDNLDELVATTFETNCRIYLPWSNVHRNSNIRRAGVFTAAMEFNEPLTEILVESIAALEKEGKRTFKPRNPWKYNRILPRPKILA